MPISMLIGFVIEGFELEYNKDSMSDIIRTVNDLLPAEKVRFINGLYLPSKPFILPALLFNHYR